MPDPFICTLTGVDEHTPIHKIARLQRQYPFVEFGVLVSPKRAGTGRYPSYQWIDALLSDGAISRRQMALHVCGEAVERLLSGAPDDMDRLSRLTRRVQLNFRYSPALRDRLAKLIYERPGATFITQYNEANCDVWNECPAPNHQVLFDRSGGRGITPDGWSVPHSRAQFGYAGGLGPENLAQQLPRIHAAAAGHNYWIDMESGLRTEDRFDLDKAEQVLEIVNFFFSHWIGEMARDIGASLPPTNEVTRTPVRSKNMH